MTREFVEELGATRVLHGKVNGLPMAIVQPASAALPEGPAIAISTPSDALHLFSAETGRSLRRSARP
jgi:sn-glycerol 3-phosphate transport system ATP-binding protein